MSFDNAGKGWTSDEDKQLISNYKKGLDINELCSIHKRNIGGIAARLIMLEIVNERKDIIGYKDARLLQRNKQKQNIKSVINIEDNINNQNIIVEDKKEKKLSKNQIAYIELQNNVKEIKEDIKQIKNNIKELMKMVKAIYEFEDSE